MEVTDDLKVPMKRNFFSHIFEIYCLKYTIPKFYMFTVKIDDFISLQSCAILPSKVVREWVRVKPNYLNVTSFGCQKFVFVRVLLEARRFQSEKTCQARPNNLVTIRRY